MQSSLKLMMVGVLSVVCSACAHEAATTRPAPGPVAAPQPKRVKLAVLPVDSDQFPRVAAGLNSLLHDVRVTGVDDYFLSKVTLEVVQLSIECVEPTSACYSAVGRSLAAQKLLIAQIGAGAGSRSRRGRAGSQPVKVSVTLFDVENGAAANVVERGFKNEQEASGGLADLLKEVVGEPGGAKAVSAKGRRR
ncbi:MAG TPA: hypothetical protein VMZ28_03150 [Kofleriaceae bacterium]|nr:hypothetical protein [Kofleriaceae bacterium]